MCAHVIEGLAERRPQPNGFDHRSGRVLDALGNRLQAAKQRRHTGRVAGEVGIQHGRDLADGCGERLEGAGGDNEGPERGQPEVARLVAAAVEDLAAPGEGVRRIEDARDDDGVHRSDRLAVVAVLGQLEFRADLRAEGCSRRGGDGHGDGSARCRRRCGPDSGAQRGVGCDVVCVQQVAGPHILAGDEEHGSDRPERDVGLVGPCGLGECLPGDGYERPSVRLAGGPCGGVCGGVFASDDDGRDVGAAGVLAAVRLCDGRRQRALVAHRQQQRAGAGSRCAHSEHGEQGTDQTSLGSRPTQAAGPHSLPPRCPGRLGSCRISHR